MKISAVYKIMNTVTKDFYIGSSKDVKSRWACHKCPSTWKQCPNKQLYKDMQKYSVDKFEFDILCEVESERLKETEQKFIEMLKPTYNSNNANGLDIERQKKYNKKYNEKYHNQLCSYNGEIITLNTLCARFIRDGIKNPAVEAKKYIIPQNI